MHIELPWLYILLILIKGLVLNCSCLIQIVTSINTVSLNVEKGREGVMQHGNSFFFFFNPQQQCSGQPGTKYHG